MVTYWDGAGVISSRRRYPMSASGRGRVHPEFGHPSLSPGLGPGRGLWQDEANGPHLVRLGSLNAGRNYALLAQVARALDPASARLNDGRIAGAQMLAGAIEDCA